MTFKGVGVVFRLIVTFLLHRWLYKVTTISKYKVSYTYFCPTFFDYYSSMNSLRPDKAQFEKLTRVACFFCKKQYLPKVHDTRTIVTIDLATLFSVFKCKIEALILQKIFKGLQRSTVVMVCHATNRESRKKVESRFLAVKPMHVLEGKCCRRLIRV